MILVSIDTSTKFASIGITNLEESYFYNWESQYNHGVELTKNLRNLLSKIQAKASDITHLAVALGPGGFSSVRVGISTALGLATPNNLPVIGVPTHDIQLEPFRQKIENNINITSIISAGRNEVSWKKYNINEITSGVCTFEKLIETSGKEDMFCGEYFYEKNGTNLSKKSILLEKIVRDPKTFNNLAKNMFMDGRYKEYNEIKPIYSREPTISSPKSTKGL
ncbi:MAG: tRNA (adenosine(37)-N6)-threonylcarbamoyltransferase complex dimerization subunit type 1 TsaB [Chloroflexi bacterium]|nr:tRNA (adenosine(37)-N6)-threonylcarbamoyltransferase complex dimerization subunit type 1 TsaB [Chloroflexota bacterium]|tara:strand:- start:12481 stop:13146 length:666 start_codon:yes stop_codon:yes gene_type:complete